MPSIPRIRRSRSPRAAAGDVGQRYEPRIQELEAHGLTWVHLERIDADTLQELAHRFGWHELDQEDVLSKRQRPKLDEYADYLFVVLHFPVYDVAIQRLNAGELDIFIGQDYLVTLPNVELLPVSRLFARCKADDELRDDLFSKGSGYLLYHVLDDLFDYCFPMLDKIGHKLDVIEDELFEERSEEAVRDISNVKQEIISYRKIIKPERSTLRLLERHTARFLPESLELYYDDLVDAAERIWDLLDNYKEVVEAPHGRQRRAAAADPDRQHLRDERRGPRRGGHPRVLGPVRADDRGRARPARAVPLAALAVKQLWAPWRLEYIRQADELPGCIFCEPEEELVVHRGELALVLLNRFPYASGHLMIAPSRHVGALGELTDEEALDVHRLAVESLEALAAAYAPDGSNLGWNLGRVAGAGVVDHVHLHVVPRWSGDTNFMPVLADVKVLPEHLTETRDRLTAEWPA